MEQDLEEPILTGETLAHRRITAALGAGGMGEVLSDPYPVEGSREGGGGR